MRIRDRLKAAIYRKSTPTGDIFVTFNGDPVGLGGGGGQLDYQSTHVPANGYDTSGTLPTGEWVDPVDPTVPNLIVAVVDVASTDACGIDVGDGLDAGLTAAYVSGTATLTITAEVPPGMKYKVYSNGPASSVNDIREIPRSG